CVYIRLLAELPSDDDDDVFSHSVFDAKPSTTVTPTTAASTNPISNTSSPSISQTSTSATNTSATNTSSATVISASTNPISPSTVRSITATVDLTDEMPVANDGDSSYQGHPVQCPFDINSIINAAKICLIQLRLTFKVGFMGEDVADPGGPRREWIRIVCRESMRTLMTPSFTCHLNLTLRISPSLLMPCRNALLIFDIG
ncbi:hypothetical protein AC249_AIPGENE9537, partial [Exaiptasia diaphana]